MRVNANQLAESIFLSNMEVTPTIKNKSLVTVNFQVVRIITV